MIVLKQNTHDDVERALDALNALEPPLDRDGWVKLLMAAHDAGVSEDDACAWSERGPNFDERAFRSAWRSIRPGAVTARTLYKAAIDAGWRAPAERKSLTAEQIAQYDGDRARRREQADKERAEGYAEAAQRAQRLWDAAAPADAHPYLDRKGVQAHGLRVGNWEYTDASTGEVYKIPGCLLIPMRDRTRKLWSLQCIEPDAKAAKRYLKGGAKRGNFFPVGSKPLEHDGRKVFVLAEGYATCASVHEATGHMVLCCFDASNLLAVAQQVRERDANAIILFAADNDLWNRKPDGTPYNPGVEAATKAAKEVAGIVAIPPFTLEDAFGVDEKGNPVGPTDFNDWYGINGGQSVAQVIAEVLVRPVTVVLAPDRQAATGAAFAMLAMQQGDELSGDAATFVRKGPSDLVVQVYGGDLAQRAAELCKRYPFGHIYIMARPGEEWAALTVADAHGVCAETLAEFGGGRFDNWFDAMMAKLDAVADANLAAREMVGQVLERAVAAQDVQGDAGALEQPKQPTGGDHGRPPAARKRTSGVAAAPTLGFAQAAADAGIASPQEASTPAAQASSGVEREDGNGLIAEVGIIPLGSHGGDLVFWRRDFKRVVLMAPKALGSHQGLQCLAPTQKWEAWWRGGGKDFKPQFASNVLINWSVGLGDVDISRVPATDAKPGEVREAFLRAKAAASGTSPAPVVLAELLALAPEWRGIVFFDEFSARATYSVNPPCGGSAGPLTDGHDDMLAAYLGSKYGISVSSKAAHDTVNLLAAQNRRHPLREYLKSREWDGVPRLDTWLIDYAGAKDGVFVRSVSAKTLIAAVERAFVPGSKVDTALVLEGAQGVKKSTLLRALAPDTSWFAEDLAGTIGGKDALQGLHGKWMIELSEIAAIKKGTVEDVKAFLTRRVDSYRSPYGRRVADHPRQCVFVGSVNPSADGSWLHDTTGGRRFWPVPVTKADVGGLAQVRDQLWAEAVHRHQAGEQHWLTEKEEEIATKEQKARLQENPWDFAVAKFLESRAFNGEPIATAEIFEFSQNRKPASKDSRELTGIAEALRARGWIMKPHGTARTNRWFSGAPI